MKNIFKKLVTYIMRLEAQIVLAKYSPKIIAITGSMGKTSTKDAVYAVVSKFAYVRKSEKSYNSEVGLPLTVLGLPNAWNNPFVWVENILRGLWLIVGPHKYPTWLVLEVGVGKPGDMVRTASWIKSDAVIITGIGETPAHIEFFESRKHLIEEKSGLIRTLKPEGVLILNADDSASLEMKDRTKCRVSTYGFGEHAETRGSGDSIAYTEAGVPTGVIFRMDERGASMPVSIEGVFGKNHMYASLAALAVASSFKWNLLTAIEALKDYDVPPGRMRLLAGINNSSIIDDTYNSSPAACEGALKTLGEVTNKGRKIAVLGDMLELGKHTEEAHKNIGKIAAGIADVLIVVGPRAKSIRESAEEVGMNKENVFEFSHSAPAGEFLKSFVKAGDLVLVKGSQGMRMERAVAAILLDQNNKHKLLVRHDIDWLKKE